MALYDADGNLKSGKRRPVVIKRKKKVKKRGRKPKKLKSKIVELKIPPTPSSSTVEMIPDLP